MKRFTEFLKTTALGGLFVLLPLLLFYLLLAEALEAIVALATPIADLFPKGTFDKVEFPVLVGLALMVGMSFLIGLAMRSASGSRLGAWIERNTLRRLPMYTAIKSLTTSLVDVEKATAFKPAMLVSSDNERQLAYVIEDHTDGHVTIMLPWSPTPFAGSVKIVHRDRIEMLDTNLADFTRVLSHWGVGTHELLVKKEDIS